MSTTNPKPQPDPRFGLPSASRADILANCPSSFHLVAAMAASGTLPASAFKEESEFGTEVHLYQELYYTHPAPLPLEFSKEVKEFAGLLNAIAQEPLENWRAKHFDGRPGKTLAEHRAIIRDAHNNPIGSAQCDLACITGKHALVIDWKTGFVEVDDASHNWQMASQAACFACDFGVESVDVWVVQPHAPKSRRLKQARYSIGDGTLANAMKEVSAVFKSAMASLQIPLQVGPWCRACAAAARCPAVREFTLKACKAEAVNDTTPTHELVALQHLKSTIERVLEDVGDQLLARINAGETIEGIVKQRRKTSEITDLDGLAKEAGVPKDTLALACSKLSSSKVYEYLEQAGFSEDRIDAMFTSYGFSNVTYFVKSVKRKKAPAPAA